MARGRLSREEIAILKDNPFVNDVSEIGIRYTNEFKFLFMKEYFAGKKPTQIFRDAGFDPKILGTKRIERATQRWKESYESGSLGSYQDSNFRKSNRVESKEVFAQLSHSECIEVFIKQQQEIERLKYENRLLRKILFKEMIAADRPFDAYKDYENEFMNYKGVERAETRERE